MSKTKPEPASQKTVKVTLGGIDYQVPRLNVGQLEDMMAAVEGAGMRHFDGLRIAMRRATPVIEDLSLIEASPSELGVALNAITGFSGVVLAKSGEARKA